MKKLLAILLALVMALTLCACGTVNEADVAVLWSGDNTQALVPNSLINAVDRAMYIENIRYTHYAAGGDAEKQLQQLDQVLHDRCAGVLVELVDPAAAQTIVDHCKEHGIPVVFFNCAVDKAVVDGYDKCAVVTTDAATLSATYGQMAGTAMEDYDSIAVSAVQFLGAFMNGDAVETTAVQIPYTIYTK
jgi:ABC-type sugar transport system substrate-binding protein